MDEYRPPLPLRDNPMTRYDLRKSLRKKRLLFGQLDPLYLSVIRDFYESLFFDILAWLSEQRQIFGLLKSSKPQNKNSIQDLEGTN